MNETDLPEDGRTPETPVPQQQPVGTTPLPAQAANPKTDGASFAIGLVSPVALGVLTGLIGGLAGTLLPDSAYGALGALLALASFLQPALFVTALVAFIVGKQKGNVRLWSFGKGGLIAYAAFALLGLLAFGSCAILGLTA